MQTPDDQPQIPFCFTVRSKTGDAEAPFKDYDVTVLLTQAQFEHQQTKVTAVHQAITGNGHDPKDSVWYENPPYDPAFIETLRQRIGADTDANMSPRYPHSLHHCGYDGIEIDGQLYLYMSFASGNHIKFAKSL